MDKETGELFILEVNAQCGLSEDENYTSIGAILKASNVSYTSVIAEILKDALRRSVVKTKTVVLKKARSTKTKKTIAVK
jgi:hypothetical protein